MVDVPPPLLGAVPVAKAAAPSRVFRAEVYNGMETICEHGLCPSCHQLTNGHAKERRRQTCHQEADGAIFSPSGDLFTDAATRKHTLKAIRALKHVALKQSATAHHLCGIGSKTVAIVFNLKKFPSKQKALQIPLPSVFLAGPLTDGLFLKTSRGKKVLAVSFGLCNMEEEALLRNALAVINAVRGCLEKRLVNEITVDLEKLALPVWNRKVSEKVKQRASGKSSVGTNARQVCMPPPVGQLSKRPRIT